MPMVSVNLRSQRTVPYDFMNTALRTKFFVLAAWVFLLSRGGTLRTHGMTIATHKDGHIRKTRSHLEKSTCPFHQDTSFIFNGVLVGRQIRLNPWTFTLPPFKKALPTFGSFSPSCRSSCFACTWNKNYEDNNSVSTTFASKQTSLAKFNLERNLFFTLVTCKKKYLCSATVALDKGRSSVLQQTWQTLRQTLKQHMHSLSEYSIV